MTATQTEPQWLRDRKAIMATCGAFGLTRPMRLEIAATFLNRNLDSFSDLCPDELSRLRDAFDGAALVASVCMERRRGERR